MGGTKEYDGQVWEKFGEKVGWIKGDTLRSYEELNWTQDTSSHHTGHLPGHAFGTAAGINGGLFSRAETCRL